MVDKQQILERDPLPDRFDSLQEAAEFWDTHSSADYEDLMDEVELEINLSSRSGYSCSIAQNLVSPLQKQARQEGVSVQTLVNLWVQERLAKAA